MTENEPIIIDASQCEWRTGVEHCGDYECMLNKSCDYNCDWYKRRKLEQQLARKEQECEELKSTRDSWLSKCEQETKIKEFYQDEFNQLKAENEELKLIREKLYIFNKELIEEKFEIHTKGKKAERKLKQIKKIIGDSRIYKEEDYGLDNITRELLQIIDEVEG